MALELNLTKNTNEQLEGTLGKYYARVEYKGTIGVKELAAHMHQHNTAFSKGIVMGVLGDMVQRTDEELQANPAAQQFAVGDVKIIMQATGNTTIENMNSEAKLSFTSKTKAMVKSLTGSEASDGENPNTPSQGGGSQQGGGSNNNDDLGDGD